MEKFHGSCQSRTNKGKKMVLGIIILLIGVVFLADNLGVLTPNVKDIIISWPMLLVAIGLINIFGRHSFVSGTILILIGVFFLLPNIFCLPHNFTRLFWPLLLIAAGILIITRHNRGFRHKDNFHAKFKQAFTYKDDSGEGYIDEVNVFGGSKHHVHDDQFKGGKIVCIFGGAEIDLSHAKLAEGKNILEIITIFGGAEIRIPSDWNVRVEVVSILGGFSDKRSINPESFNKNSELIIKGVAIFGGGEIKSIREI